MAKEEASPAEVCPVDHATRAAWLKNNGNNAPFPGAPLPSKEAAAARAGNSCDSDLVDQSPSSGSVATAKDTGFFSRFTSSAPAPTPAPAPATGGPRVTLGVDREISTIPRSSLPAGEGAKPANSEGEGGVSEGGNWIYPSEKMFFEAMKRKGYSSDAQDMKTIVPIHNAVNERAWKEIKEWERPWGAEKEYVCPQCRRGEWSRYESRQR